MKEVTQIVTTNLGLVIFSIWGVSECMKCSTICHPCEIQYKPIYTFWFWSSSGQLQDLNLNLNKL